MNIGQNNQVEMPMVMEGRVGRRCVTRFNYMLTLTCEVGDAGKRTSDRSMKYDQPERAAMQCKAAKPGLPHYPIQIWVFLRR